MAMRDKVSVLPVNLRVLAANLLVDSVGFDEVREALRERGLAEERMPSDGSFRAFQDTSEYKLVYEDRLEREMVAFEAELERSRVPEMKAAAQSRLLRRMLRDLESSELSAMERVAMWKALSTTEHQEASRADRLAMAEARVALQAEKVAVDAQCKQRSSRMSTLGELARAMREAQPDKRFQHEMASVLKGQMAVLASEDPRLFAAISGDSGESAAMVEPARAGTAGGTDGVDADRSGKQWPGGPGAAAQATEATGGSPKRQTAQAGDTGGDGEVAGDGISGDSGLFRGISGDSGNSATVRNGRGSPSRPPAFDMEAYDAQRMARFLQAQEAERAQVAAEKHRLFQEEQAAEHAKLHEEFRASWSKG